jgi:predicted transcriptional regulator
MIAKELIEEHGLKQVDVAMKMNVTPAAVTQYLKGARGGFAKMVDKSTSIQEAASKLAIELTKEQINSASILNILCQTCKDIRRDRFLCKFCGELMPDLDINKCKICCAHIK